MFFVVAHDVTIVLGVGGYRLGLALFGLFHR